MKLKDCSLQNNLNQQLVIMKLHSLLIALLCLTLTSCEEEKELKLGTEKENYTGSLRTDGYYYLTIANETEERTLSYFLYRDGTLLYGGAPLISGVAQRESEYENGTWKISASGEKTYWGIFKITNNDILFDQWYIRDGGLLAAYQTNGTIQPRRISWSPFRGSLSF